MSRQELRMLSMTGNADDSYLFVVRKDFSGGINTRQNPSVIGENQAVSLKNVDLSIAGQLPKRPGSVLIATAVSSNNPLGLHNFDIQGATDQLLMYEGTSLHKWIGSGSWTTLKSNFSTATEVGICSVKESGLSPDDVVIIQNGVDNAFRLDSAGNFQDLGDTNTSPPKSTVMCWYGNRLWVLKNDLLYYSDAYDDDYSGAFDRTTKYFRIPVGDERKIIPTRDAGMVIMGREQIWALKPSTVPAATDQPEPLITNMGVVSKQGAVAYGDSIYFFSQDGFRELRRTIQDKLQVGVSYPLSYRLKDEFERISWAYIEKLSMIAFDNKIFITVPTSSTTFDTWIYYPASDAFAVIEGWTPYCWATYKVNGEERLYYGKAGSAYRAWYGYTDEGTTTTNGTAVSEELISRKESIGQELVEKIGGELEVSVIPSGNYKFTVSINIDDTGWQSLGTIDLTYNLVTFPCTFPVIFPSSGEIYRKKFHLDRFGTWRNVQFKITNNDTNIDEVVLLGYSIQTLQEQYDNE